jgi:hypothetical protein
MITREDWKQLSLDKVVIVKRLLEYEEWVVAGEYMGYALECALKAATCKTLNNACYPPIKTSLVDGTKSGVGMKPAHEFDVLLVYSGLSDIFNDSNFTWQQLSSYYAGAWNERRYDKNVATVYDEASVKEIAKLLYDTEDSIIQMLQRNDRW